MSKKEESKGGDVKVKRGDLTVVAEDTNWRTYVSKEIQAENDFNENWGFLTYAAQSKLLTFNT
jgi:hypothetical protein